MIDNPFLSKTFAAIWSKHFNNSKPGYVFSFIENVSFIKQKFPSHYVNLGKNLTSSINYKLKDEQFDDYKGRTFLIRDIPSYLEMNGPNKKSHLRLEKIFQYEGYLAEIEKFDNLDQYMTSIYSQKRRKDLRRSFNRLEKCFDLNYKMYHGEIEKDEFDFIFQKFYNLLDKRYSNKQERCAELDPSLWAYYSDLVYPMILEKRASLFVVYNQENPIGIRFIYNFGTTLILWLSVFDIDYYKFSLGKNVVYKLLEWSFQNGVTLIDFTHGDFEWKKTWSSNTYQKHHHLLYDSSSINGKSAALFIEMKFKLKRFLRDKKLIKKYNNLKFKVSSLKNKKSIGYVSYDVNSVSEDIPKNEYLELISIYDDKYMSQRKAVFDFIYKHQESINKYQFYKHKDLNNVYYALGETNTLLIKLSL